MMISTLPVCDGMSSKTIACAYIYSRFGRIVLLNCPLVLLIELGLVREIVGPKWMALFGLFCGSFTETQSERHVGGESVHKSAVG